MLWAAVTMCFCGFLRSGAIVVTSLTTFDPSVHLCYGDVTVDSTDSPTLVRLQRQTLFGQAYVCTWGLLVAVYICPVAAILDYMVRRGSDEGPFFTFADESFLIVIVSYRP